MLLAAGVVILSVSLISISLSWCHWDGAFTANGVMKIHLIRLYWPFSHCSPRVGIGHYLAQLHQLCSSASNHEQTVATQIEGKRNKGEVTQTDSVYLHCLEKMYIDHLH